MLETRNFNDHDGDMDSVRLTIDKFTGAMDTFLPWSKKAAIYLYSKGLAEIAGVERDGTPTKTLPRAPKTRDEIRRDDVAKSAIQILMVRDQVTSTAGLTSLATAALYWRALHAAFNPSTKSTIGRALSTFVSASQLPDETVQAYVSRVRDAAQRLRAVAPIGLITFSDELTALLLIRGLRSEFNVAFAPIHTRSSQTPLTTEEVLAVAAQEEMRKQDEASRPTIVGSANAAAVNSTDVFELQALRAEIALLRKASPTADDSPCHMPRHVGHTNKQCFSQHPELRQAYQTRRIANTTSASNYAKPALSARAASSTSSPDDEAIWDSGATSHMLTQRKLFTSYQTGQGPPIHLGDNSTIGSTGSGSSATIPGQTEQHPLALHNATHVPKLGKSLLSVGQYTGEGYKLVFHGDRLDIFAAHEYQPRRAQSSLPFGRAPTTCIERASASLPAGRPTSPSAPTKLHGRPGTSGSDTSTSRTWTDSPPDLSA